MSEHKRHSPSSLHRVMVCTASLGFIESLPPSLVDRSDSIYARRGTAGHGVSEMVLNNTSYESGRKEELAPVETFLGQTVEEVIIDEEILAAIVPYIKYCQKQMRISKFWRAENKLDLGSWTFLKRSILDGYECGGTMDFASVYDYKEHTVLEVTDLKTGAGVGVEVEHNPQLLCYALCCLLKFYKKYRPTRVKITVVQPPYDHPEGPIRSIVMTPRQLIHWGENVLVPKLEEALSPNAVFAPSEETCQWCPGRAQCHARYEMACSNALAEFTDVTEIDDEGTSKEITILKQPAILQLTKAQKHNILIHGDEIITFVHDIKADAHIQAEKGAHIEGHKLVRKRANRIYISEEKIVRKELSKLGLHNSDFINPPTLRSPAQVETVMSAKGISLDKTKQFLDNHVDKPESGTNLVLDSKPGKPVRPAVETEFAHLIENDGDEDLLAL